MFVSSSYVRSILAACRVCLLRTRLSKPMRHLSGAVTANNTAFDSVSDYPDSSLSFMHTQHS